MNVESIFKIRITEAIKNSNFTQKQIAKILQISESNITNWKNGENLPSVDLLYRLCILLDESADYLLGLEDESGARTSNTINNSGIFHNSGTIKF